jgi:hypothetical protein
LQSADLCVFDVTDRAGGCGFLALLASLLYGGWKWHACHFYLSFGAVWGDCPVFNGTDIQESHMSNRIKAVLAVGIVAALAACAQQEEQDFVVVEPEPISVEPVYTGKYK